MAEGVTTVEIKSGYGLDVAERVEDAARSANGLARAGPLQSKPPALPHTPCRRK
jgi:hypothetical protein